jgi:hypothetical protein
VRCEYQFGCYSDARRPKRFSGRSSHRRITKRCDHDPWEDGDRFIYTEEIRTRIGRLTGLVELIARA